MNHLEYCAIDSTASNQFDLVVIGGGSGGLACAKEAATFGKKVAILDYVKPSVHGTSWGLGGTCVNVGCIPKKLMHESALIGQAIRDAKSFGWDVAAESKVSVNVQKHIRSLNWGYRVQMNQNSVTYLNAYGSFVDANTIKAVDKANKEVRIITSKDIVIATGLRPKYPEIEGAEEGISSDDIFSLPRPPSKTLVVGGNVGLECAGFLSGLGYPVTLMVRSIPLRGFDQVEWEDEVGKSNSDLFDTVLWAIGREPRLSDLNLDAVGVKCDSKSGRILVNEKDQTTVSNIYAIGDIQHGRAELTPVAIKAGKLLARRLYSDSQLLMNYDNIPTTVFTPVEYSCVGLSEELAVEKFGANEIEVYHASFKPLEFIPPQRVRERCYLKVICTQTEPQHVLGLHYIGPNAGEIMQGFSVSLRCKLTIPELLNSIGIHPTCAEEFVKLNITKRSGKDAVVTDKVSAVFDGKYGGRL
ncbi:thioredoxin reductase 1, cytoplasmic [Trichinella spiralis]|uniref:thioredoxin reductase 1, cytoplasmic n=1 Tax=Trichinella spiralis TaxID=6334 RepID=UPI0001EFCC93|nr:thioredoxin reductase 1, cytoplasmic [Trichinella spiralis]